MKLIWALTMVWSALSVMIGTASAADFDIADYGARPEGGKCTAAFARAIEACETAGCGRVIVPKGRYYFGGFASAGRSYFTPSVFWPFFPESKFRKTGDHRPIRRFSL